MQNDERIRFGVNNRKKHMDIVIETQVQVQVFWVTTPRRDVVGYQRFGALASFITSP
jgi:hypothetical protein